MSFLKIQVFFLFFFVTVCFSDIVVAQVINPNAVPDIVKKKLEEKFPGASASWSQDAPGFLNADFNYEKHKVEVMLTVNGNWVSTDTKLKPEEFPQEAISYLNANFSGAKFVALTKSETTKATGYESEIKTKDGKKYRITFDAAGKMLESNQQKEE